jgi:hypothetical protein
MDHQGLIQNLVNQGAIVVTLLGLAFHFSAIGDRQSVMGGHGFDFPGM